LLGESARIASGALLAGGAVTLAIVPLMRKLALADGGNDLLTIAFVAVLLVAVALLASWLPAQRAAAQDPLRAIGQR
jgi:ABC-type lipoprotein release transport system permease subunit